jgi:multiple sugar transport system permease protein
VLSRRTYWQSYVMLFPYIIFLLAFGLLPTFYTVYLSVTDNSSQIFVGITNFMTAFGDFRFLSALKNVFLFMLIWLPAMLVVVSTLSLLLHVRQSWFSETMKMLYYIPGAITGSASVLVWLFMFTPSLSPFGGLFGLFGVNNLVQTLNADQMPWVIAIMTLFASAGFWIVVIYGALMGIPKELLEAAQIDGCNDFQLATRIKLPLVSRYLVLMLILSFAGGIQVFVEPQVIYSATLKSFGNSTWSLNQLAYNYVVELGNFSISAALSLGLLLISLALALIVIYKTDFYRTEAAE